MNPDKVQAVSDLRDDDSIYSNEKAVDLMFNRYEAEVLKPGSKGAKIFLTKEIYLNKSISLWVRNRSDSVSNIYLNLATSFCFCRYTPFYLKIFMAKTFSLDIDREDQKQNICSLNISLNHKTLFYLF